jgi:hypothetical protein
MSSKISNAAFEALAKKNSRKRGLSQESYLPVVARTFVRKIITPYLCETWRQTHVASIIIAVRSIMRLLKRPPTVSLLPFVGQTSRTSIFSKNIVTMSTPLLRRLEDGTGMFMSV